MILLGLMLNMRGKGGKSDSKVLGLSKCKNGAVIYCDGERMQAEHVLGLREVVI